MKTRTDYAVALAVVLIGLVVIAIIGVPWSLSPPSP